MLSTGCFKVVNDGITYFPISTPSKPVREISSGTLYPASDNAFQHRLPAYRRLRRSPCTESASPGIPSSPCSHSPGSNPQGHSSWAGSVLPLLLFRYPSTPFYSLPNATYRWKHPFAGTDDRNILMPILTQIVHHLVAFFGIIHGHGRIGITAESLWQHSGSTQDKRYMKLCQFFLAVNQITTEKNNAPKPFSFTSFSATSTSSSS